MNSFLYGFQILKKIFKNGFYKVVFAFLIFLIAILFTIYNNTPVAPISFTSIRFALGLSWFYFLAIIWFLFQVGTTIYLSYLYFFYEVENSSEFIFLRTDFYHFAIKKYFVFLIFLTICRVVLYFIVYLFFIKYVPLSLNIFLINIGLHILIATIMLIFSIIKHSSRLQISLKRI